MTTHTVKAGLAPRSCTDLFLHKQEESFLSKSVSLSPCSEKVFKTYGMMSDFLLILGHNSTSKVQLTAKSYQKNAPGKLSCNSF